MLLLKQNSQASLAAPAVDSDIVDLALFMKLQILYRSLWNNEPSICNGQVSDFWCLYYDKEFLHSIGNIDQGPYNISHSYLYWISTKDEACFRPAESRRSVHSGLDLEDELDRLRTILWKIVAFSGELSCLRRLSRRAGWRCSSIQENHQRCLHLLDFRCLISYFFLWDCWHWHFLSSLFTNILSEYWAGQPKSWSCHFGI